MFQALVQPVSRHVIIEPHPDVLNFMKETGWYDKPSVTILEGKWQEFVDTEKMTGFGGFDVIYIDTFAENYRELRAFFECLPDLVSGPDSRFSFFNGLGATRKPYLGAPGALLILVLYIDALFYDVYTHLSELHLADLGIDVAWQDVAVGDNSVERWGDTREYFKMPLYRLPIGRMRAI
jgi:type IV protein arginine methyltransferase